jgi:hypothetical protein
MTVTEYLRQMRHPTTGQVIFDHVNPTINGKREFLITRNNSGDAETLLKVIQEEIARKVNIEAIQREFINELEVMEEMEDEEWCPFERTSMLQGAPIEKKTVTTNFNKQSRIHKESEHYGQQNKMENVQSVTTTRSYINSGQSYAQVANDKVNSSIIPIHTKIDPEYTSLKTHVETLQETVVELKNQVSMSVASNNKLEQKIVANSKDNLLEARVSFEAKIQKVDEKIKKLETTLDNTDINTQTLMMMFNQMNANISNISTKIDGLNPNNIPKNNHSNTLLAENIQKQKQHS